MKIKTYLEELAALCQADGMHAHVTRDPGLIIVPPGKGWGGGNYIYVTALFLRREGVHKCYQSVKEAEARMTEAMSGQASKLKETYA